MSLQIPPNARMIIVDAQTCCQSSFWKIDWELRQGISAGAFETCHHVLYSLKDTRSCPCCRVASSCNGSTLVSCRGYLTENPTNHERVPEINVSSSRLICCIKSVNDVLVLLLVIEYCSEV